MGADPRDVVQLAEGQARAVTRSQLLELGAPAGMLADRVRQGRWQSPYPGVAVVHTGPMAWRTRAWAALLYSGRGAALSHASAAFHWGMTRAEPRVVEVSVPWERRVARQRGLRVYLRRGMPESYGALRAVHPPETVLDLWAAEADLDAAIGILTAATRARIPLREVARAARGRERLPRRRLLSDLLTEVGAGIESPLERRYRRDVEGRHRLPPSALQVRSVVGHMRIRADVVYPGMGVRVELDGVLGHPGGRTAADTWRDNAVVIERAEVTLRYRWTHVAVTPCATAGQVAQALRSRGWTGTARGCGPRCPHAQHGTAQR